MKPRTVLGAIALATISMSLFLAAPAQAAEPPLYDDVLSGASADGKLGPGLSELVAIAEGILRESGITK